MGRILTIAHHTVREALRMKVVVAFAALIVVVVAGLPFTLKRPDATVSYMVQTFLAWSITPLGVILSFLAIFLGCQSISDEMYHRQIYILATKPVPRWQYVLGKWTGVVQVLTALLIFGGLAIYGVGRFLAGQEPIDEIDRYTLTHEVLTARAHSSLAVPDFTAEVEKVFQLMVEEGRFSQLSKSDERREKAQIMTAFRQQWRAVQAGETRAFAFKDLRLVTRSSENVIQLRYKAKGLGYAQDETLQMDWFFGDRRNADVFLVRRRDVMDRYHVIPFPASTISPDGVLHVQVQNLDYDRPDGHAGATISFEADAGFQVLYKIGTFEGNLMRTLFLVWCRVVFIAGLGVLAATFLSYPVACLLTFMGYVLAVSGQYVQDALGFGGATSGVLGSAKPAVKAVLESLFWLWPAFGRYDGVPQFVDGRNVSLLWDLQALGKLVLLLTTVALMIACIVFRRRQVAELSV